MKKLCCCLLGLVLLAGTFLLPTSVLAHPPAAGQAEMYLEFQAGKPQGKGYRGQFVMPEAPYAKNNHTMMPVRGITQQLGGAVDYDGKTGRVTLTFGKITIVLQEGKTECWVDGQLRYMPVAPQRRGNKGTIFVPLRFLAETIGVRVDYLPNGKIVVRGKCYQQRQEDPEPAQPSSPKSVAHKVVSGVAVKEVVRQAKHSEPVLYYGPATKLLVDPPAKLLDKNVLVVARGWMGSTGYGIETESVDVVEDELVTTVRLVDPAPDSFQAAVMQFVYQVLYLPQELPSIQSWRIQDITGKTIQRQQLPGKIALTQANDADVSWADLTQAGIEAQLVAVDGQDKLLVVAKRGHVPSTGYGITIERLYMPTWGTLVAEVSYTDPAPGSGQAAVMQQPYDAVYIDPLYLGHKLNLETVKRVYDNLRTVPSRLAANIDLTQRRVIIGYGRDLLQKPGMWADQFLLVAMRGMCPTGGYSIAVEQLVRQGDTVQVQVTETDPAPDAMVTMAFTYPTHIVAIPEELKDCRFSLEPSHPAIIWNHLPAVAGEPNRKLDKRQAAAHVGWGRDLLQNPQEMAGEVVLVAMLGERPSGGYDIEISQVRQVGSNLEVRVREIAPPSDAPVTTVMTYPYVIVKGPPQLGRFAASADYS